MSCPLTLQDYCGARMELSVRRCVRDYKMMNTSPALLLDNKVLRKILSIHSFILYPVPFQFDN